MTQHPSIKRSLEETKVSYTQLGTSGLRVSVPILGSMSFGHKDWAPWVMDDEDEIMQLIKGAYDRGLNTWDTANMYSNGLSEELIGKAIKKFNIPRHKVVIMSKCFGAVGEEPGIGFESFSYPGNTTSSKDYVNQCGLSRQAIFSSINASLKRLGTDYLDVLQIHRYDPTVPAEETMKALHDLVQWGKVRYIGASSMWAYQLSELQYTAQIHGFTKFISMQNQYSLCYREEEREMIPYCQKSGVGLIPWAPLYSGLLARRLDSATSTIRAQKIASQISVQQAKIDRAIISRVEEIATKRGWKMSQVALAWVIQKGAVPIVGFNSLGRLDEAVAVRGKILTAEEIKYLEEPYQPRAVVGHL